MVRAAKAAREGREAVHAYWSYRGPDAAVYAARAEEGRRAIAEYTRLRRELRLRARGQTIARAIHPKE
jgi:hypothetical protein